MGYLKHKLIEQDIERCGCERGEEPVSPAVDVGAWMQSRFEEDVALRQKAADWLMLYGDGETSLEQVMERMRAEGQK